MSADIRNLLDEWPYDSSDELMVRRIIGPHGTARLQVRLELGLLEMAVEGRPDGEHPGGFPTLLDFHLSRIRRELLGEDEDHFALDHDECAALQRESMQYYHRRLAYLRLGDYALAAADAEHNLAIMDLLRDRAADRGDWLASEQYRAFVLTHWTRARMLEALESADLESALSTLDEGIDTIEKLYRDEYQRPDLIDRSSELEGLRQIRRALIEHDPPKPERLESEEQRLERELGTAVGNEDFERAAVLRDELTRLRHRP